MSGGTRKKGKTSGQREPGLPGTSIHPKVAAGTIGCLLTTVGLWVLRQYAGVAPPPDVAAAITGLIGGAGGWLARSLPSEVAPQIVLTQENGNGSRSLATLRAERTA